MSFQYDQKELDNFLLLSELFNRMQQDDIKDLIESFSYFYNESKYGPDCKHTIKTYLLLQKDQTIKNIFANIKKIK